MVLADDCQIFGLLIPRLPFRLFLVARWDGHVLLSCWLQGVKFCRDIVHGASPLTGSDETHILMRTTVCRLNRLSYIGGSLVQQLGGHALSLVGTW